MYISESFIEEGLLNKMKIRKTEGMIEALDAGLKIDAGDPKYTGGHTYKNLN